MPDIHGQMNTFEDLQKQVNAHRQAITELANRLNAVEEQVTGVKDAFGSILTEGGAELERAKNSLDNIQASLAALTTPKREDTAVAKESKRKWQRKQTSRTSSVMAFRDFLAGYQANELNLKDVPKEAITYWAAQKVQLQIAGFKKVPGMRGLWRRGA
jgi:ABC-type transporter Mla subunit MlaD